MSNKIGFTAYLKEQLGKAPSDHYNPKGSSARATVSRGFLGEIWYQAKNYHTHLFEMIVALKYLAFGVINLVFLILGVTLFPIILVAASAMTYRRALKQYRKGYTESLRNADE